jgi:hypothetical protein
MRTPRTCTSQSKQGSGKQRAAPLAVTKGGSGAKAGKSQAKGQVKSAAKSTAAGKKTATKASSPSGDSESVSGCAMINV